MREERQQHGDVGMEFGCPHCSLRVLVSPAEVPENMTCPSHHVALVATGKMLCRADRKDES